MKLKELADRLQMEVKAGAAGLEAEVTGGYASDLLSDVMANRRAAAKSASLSAPLT